jgi:hypothetical protein
LETRTGREKVKLTDKQRKVLEQGATGVSIRFVWRWTIGRENMELATREVNGLIKRGLMKAAYYSGGQASASPTEEGRRLLQEVE